MKNNVIPFRPKIKYISQITCLFQHAILEDGSVWHRVKWEDEEEWRDWEKINE